MIVLADNDLILKLAQCDLLSDLPQLLGISQHHQIFITPSARYQLLPQKEAKALAKAGNETTLNSLREFLGNAHEIPAIEDEAYLMKMEDLDGIDGGEQQLFAAMLELDQPFLATGDKRALSAVTTNQASLPELHAALQDRVLTFESAILLAIVEFGFPNVKQRLLGNPKPDGVLKLVLKDSVPEEELIACLVSFSAAQLPFLARKDRIGVFYDRPQA